MGNKRIYLYITYAAALFALVLHFELVLQLLGYVSDLLMPVIVGLIMAFILNVPVKGFENLFHRIFRKRKRKPSEKHVHGASILLSVVCVVLVLAILCVLVIPELFRTVKSIAQLIDEQWPNWLAMLERYHINTDGLKAWFSSIAWNNMFHKVSGYAGTIIGSIADAATSTVSVVSLVITGSIIALYTLSDRNKLAYQAKTMLYAYMKPKHADHVLYVCRLTQIAYTKFLTGQCVESILLGVLIAIAFTMFRLPYAALVGAVTAICALIPYIGAFISCTLGVILALMVSPEKAVTCLIVYLSVQFIEGQFIYPRVVGGSVGLSPLWTLIAVLIGGKLFGLVGMIFFIPLVSVGYQLIKERVMHKLEERNENNADSDSELQHRTGT